MRPLFILSLCLILALNTSIVSAQTTVNWKQEVEKFQRELNEEFADPAQSPLPKSELKKFKGLTFFEADSLFLVEAKFVRTPGQLPFEMPTTTGRKAIYEKYGELHFMLQGQAYTLTVYQSHTLREREGYEDYLFLPFTDATNGITSYGGGRYIDLRIPEGDKMMLDFNKAYNPFCAYNYNYSCPIPPKENKVTEEIKAGVMTVN